MNEEIERLLKSQAGVVSRRQSLSAGLKDQDIRRLLRGNDWSLIHDGVYVDHTGSPTWIQRAWAGVLFAWPAALSHDSALRAADGPGRRDRTDGAAIHVAVDRNRAFRAPPGVVPHRLADLVAKVQWNLGPPRIRVEHAVLDVAASARDELSVIATLADAVQSRRTTAERLLDTLGARSRIARRQFLTSVLRDVADGTCSVLEHAYLDRVERPHGLPVAARQLLDSTRNPLYRDAVYEQFGLIVELDGRLFHDSTHDRDRDLDRDLDAALDAQDTVRLGWGQAYTRSCETAAKIGALLEQRGWEGSVTQCPDCPSEDGSDLTSANDFDSPLSA